MLSKERVKSVLKQAPLYRLHYPKFGRPYHGDMQHEAWLLGEIDKHIMHPGYEWPFSGEHSGFIAEILDIAKSKSTLREDDWNDSVRGFESKINGTSCNALRSLQWKDLNFIACRFGLHRAGYEFRKKAFDYLYEKGTENKNIDELCELFTAAMEKGDYETAGYIINNKLCKGWKKHLRSIRHAQDYYNFFRGYDSRMKTVKKYHTQEDAAFAEYVKGKRIAVAGPSQPEVPTGPEIDTYDIIARMAYQGKEHISREYAGSRTDVSYYCGWRGMELVNMEDRDFLYDLDYIVQKDPQCRVNMNSAGERALHSLGFLFAGYLNMIPLAVMDLLFFDPAEIKIFNTNFHLSAKPYIKGFSEVMKHIALTDSDEILKAITTHDQISQISFIRNLWNMKLCAADDECKAILSLSNEEIMSLSCKYHPYTWMYATCRLLAFINKSIYNSECSPPE